ncbi:hypothetical protein [Pontibacter beigongshangensis]|uniref:hypothetical protein n=1 Tax=Pontibacter beigongshangensis TaxID=2574733 RepID=UPI001650529D|nr:hypothetical protein [Pontibacter beigongshangensis]
MTTKFTNPFPGLSFLKEFNVFVLFLTVFAAACQAPEQEHTDGTTAIDQTEAAAADSAAQQERRPAPQFHRIPTEMARDRVYVCDDANADVFHTKYDCETLNGCKTLKKNVMLLRAVEDYGRYNCDICSKDLAVIFDEQQVIQRR